MTLLQWLALPHRSDKEEMLDGPLPGAEALRSNLRELAWVNRWAGGVAVVVRALERALADRPAGAVRLLDIATGGADIPVAVARWGRARGLDLTVDAVDLRPEIVELARESAAGEPAVQVRQGDALALGLPQGAYDVVVCSLALHHFDPAAAVRLLREAWRLTGGALIINDLRRSRLAWAATTLVAKTLFRSVEARHDGPLSVLRAYTVPEVEALAKEAELSKFEVFPCPPFRLCLFARRPAGGAAPADNQEILEDTESLRATASRREPEPARERTG